MSGTWLLDVNLLLAWLWPKHQAHISAQSWRLSHLHEPWATCPVTEMGFLRIVTNRSFSPHAPGWAEAVKLLTSHTESSPNHSFWQDSLSLPEVNRRIGAHIMGPNQITDAYLLCLAVKNGGCLVTFDSRMHSLAPKGSAEHDALVILKP